MTTEPAAPMKAAPRADGRPGGGRDAGRPRPGGVGRTTTAIALSLSITLGGGATVAWAQPPGPSQAPVAPSVEAPVPEPAAPMNAPQPVQALPPAEMAPPPPPAAWSLGPTGEPPGTVVEHSRVPAILLWAVGGASLVVGAAFGIAAISAKNDFNDKPTYERADAVHNRAVISDVGFGLGIVLVATGTAFFFGASEAAGPMKVATNASSPAPAVGRLRLDPLVGRSGGGGVVTMRF